jgi:hypothetical protein
MRSLLKALELAVVVSAALFAQEYPKATGYVNDFAGLLSPQDAGSLNSELIAFEEKLLSRLPLSLSALSTARTSRLTREISPLPGA